MGDALFGYLALARNSLNVVRHRVEASPPPSPDAVPFLFLSLTVPCESPPR